MSSIEQGTLRRLSDWVHDLVIVADDNVGHFDQWRRVIGMVFGPLAALAILLLPFEGLSSEAHRLAAVAALVIIFWVTEAMPLPAASLLAIVLIVLAGIAPAADALDAFGDQIIFLFIGSFILARIMQIHRVDQRIAYALLSHSWVGGSTYRTIWTIGLTTWLLGMWISNTAAVAMLVPVVLAVGRSARTVFEAAGVADPEREQRRYTTGLLLMLAYAASMGGIATPVGTPPNLIGIALIADATGERISFVTWMSFGLPIAAVMLLLGYGLIIMRYRPAIGQVESQLETMRAARARLGPWTPGQRNSVLAFSVAVICWLLPGLSSTILGADHEISRTLAERLPEGIVALLAATLLFVLPTDPRRRRYTATWEDAVRIDWGTVLLFGGGISLGRMMTQTGLAESIGSGLLDAIGVESQGGLTAFGVLICAIVGQVTSNTASVNILLPVAISTTQVLGVSTTLVAVAVTLAASMACMLPVSTPPNAIIYGTGQVSVTDMAVTGFIFNVLGIVVVWLASLWLVPTMLDLVG
ncbi:MAG TPA: DASS family sodium-coupled anion symporter [Thermomicrobiales bacterium]|nr:DASS family sodium-coupled anion symporter [Thermomicrobiales bacterium]